MNTQRKTFNILGFGIAALAAGLIGAAQPASAAGLTHPRAFTRTTAIADHDDRNNRDRDSRDRDNRRDFQRQQDFRRDQALRRQAEFRREQEVRRAEERRREDFRRHDDRRDYRNNGRHEDSLQIVIR